MKCKDRENEIRNLHMTMVVAAKGGIWLKCHNQSCPAPVSEGTYMHLTKCSKYSLVEYLCVYIQICIHMYVHIIYVRIMYSTQLITHHKVNRCFTLLPFSGSWAHVSSPHALHPRAFWCNLNDRTPQIVLQIGKCIHTQANAGINEITQAVNPRPLQHSPNPELVLCYVYIHMYVHTHVRTLQISHWTVAIKSHCPLLLHCAQ